MRLCDRRRHPSAAMIRLWLDLLWLPLDLYVLCVLTAGVRP